MIVATIAQLLLRQIQRVENNVRAEKNVKLRIERKKMKKKIKETG